MTVSVGTMHTTDVFYSTYAVDNVCCNYPGLEVLLQLCRWYFDTVILVDLSVAIIQVTISVAIMQLEISIALMQVTISSNNFIFLSLTDNRIS